jgi:chemotaxis protein CheX
MAAAAMFGLSAVELTDAEVTDAVGELTNIIGGNIKSLLPGPSRLSMPVVTISPADAVRMPAAAPVNAVWLTCEGLPLTVGVWPGRPAWPCGDGTPQ